MGNTRKIWTDSNCRILLLPIHKYFSDVLKTREEFFISQIEDFIRIRYRLTNMKKTTKFLRYN